jgi:hypothetical protein
MNELCVYPKGSPKIAYEGKYIYFYKIGEKPKTSVYGIFTKEDNDYLGEISWRGGWRKYKVTFKPDKDFEEVCLEDIIVFLKMITKKQLRK